MFGDMRRSRAGTCKERPRTGKAGRRGVIGLSFISLSSFDFLFSGSRNLGDGDKVGGPPSDSDRAFEGDLEGPFRSGVFASAGFPSPETIGKRVVSFN